MRTLKLVVFSVIFFLSSNLAHSLGVGDIKVNSALNEPLNAEIQLVSLRAGEIDNIRARLATPAEFARAGIERPFVLSLLKFRVEERPGNKAAIVVYSKKPIKEPFLDFLVEIDWSSGRMLREYTMLLDPPVLAQRKAERVQAPVAVAPAPVVNKPVPAPAPAAPVERKVPVSAAPVVVESSSDELFPRVDIDRGAQSAKSEEPFKPALDVSSDGYKVKKNDTLWSISDRLRPEGISIEQMMLALQNTNPEAFEGQNINGLKAGYVLRIPDQEALLAFSKSEAFREAQNQHKAWTSARGGLVSRETTKGTAPVTKEPAPVATEAKTDAGVKLVTPESGVASKGAGTGKDLDALRQELALVNEQLASKEQHNTELEGRLRELEEQIASMERLLELKSKSLEELQSKVSEPAPAPAVTELAPAPVEEPVAETSPVEPVKPAEPAVDGEIINKYAVKDLPKVEVPPAPAAKPTPTPKPVAPKPAAPKKEESLIDTILSILDDTTVLAMLGAALIAVLALVWVVMHRRRMNSMSFPESILTDKGAATEMEKEESSLLSDFAPTSMGSTNIESEMGEVDPLSEADVYLAYNKYQQAEELLQSAIDGEPDRIDLKVKLLEVHYNAKNSNAFAELAEDVHSAMGDQDAALWDKVTDMGGQLCPDNPLFSAPEVDENVLDIAEIDEGDTSAAESTDDLEFDLGDLELDEEPEAEPEAVEEDLALDIADEPATADDAMDIDLGDLDDLSLDVETESAAEESKEEPADLSLDMESADSGDDLGELEMTLDEAPAEEKTADESMDLGEIDLDALDAAIAMDDTKTAEPVAEAEVSADAADDGFGIDEVATKLDLAKAYIDMGDPDGAKSILDEVLNEGNDAQKSEAQDLIQQL